MKTTATKERPIVLSADEVRGLLDGTLTEIARAIKPQPKMQQFVRFEEAIPWMPIGGIHQDRWECPLGKPGDRLLVKETWRLVFGSGHGRLQKDGRYKTDNEYQIDYKAGGDRLIQWTGYDMEPSPYTKHLSRYESEAWQSSTQMPRWASRFGLKNTSVRVEKRDPLGWVWVVGVKRIEVKS